MVCNINKFHRDDTPVSCQIWNRQNRNRQNWRLGAAFPHSCRWADKEKNGGDMGPGKNPPTPRIEKRGAKETGYMSTIGGPSTN